ncbi:MULTISPECIES: AmmeMemoRadiSam system protein A [Niveibacterium]|uniref:AmmeMemoRadiSam system protein A n=1 Tax=Niveibacterium microcysteis TaxID=2811415 RepID=A0ABX7M2T8_9RHOO|nr:AmmeMemoRadiSam system protein A [Niveibacterium microcysteis]QSI75088.1 AmmeMemoRadiSam system protein A [Niveibacterium microcysteis]
MLTENGSLLVAHARHAIASRLGLDFPEPDDAPALHKPGAAFVTLTHFGRLRGCIGSLTPQRALGEDIAANAAAAAFHDPRFPPVAPNEWGDLQVEVSVLGPTEWRVCATEADAIAWIRPGVDGVILEYGAHRATFLPQVWESLSEPSQFLTELRRKAGMRLEHWPDTMHVGRYQVEKFHDA